MGKKKQPARTVEERCNALADKLERLIVHLQLAAQALRIAQPHEEQIGYFERCFDHMKHEMQRFSERTVFSANIWPGAKEMYEPHGAPDDLKVEITTKLQHAAADVRR